MHGCVVVTYRLLSCEASSLHEKKVVIVLVAFAVRGPEDSAELNTRATVKRNGEEWKKMCGQQSLKEEQSSSSLFLLQH